MYEKYEKEIFRDIINPKNIIILQSFSSLNRKTIAFCKLFW